MGLNINEVIKAPEYGFLDDDTKLGSNIVFLTFGGSHAYGTATETSDIDIRGCVYGGRQELLGFGGFEQVKDDATDTVLYDFKKLVLLLSACNPNIIEMLGCKPEHYIIRHRVADMLIANRNMFLSKRAVHSFGGYGVQQLRRLQNAIARDALDAAEKEQHILSSIKNAMYSFNERYKEFEEGSVQLYIGKSDKEDLDTEILMDIKLKGYPLRDYRGMWNEMSGIVKSYEKLNHRNKKKDEYSLNNHAMHLVRLNMMLLDILEKGEINTYRKDDIGLLMPIKKGRYMNSDGTYQPEFFEIVDSYENRVAYAAKNTSLPDKPNMKTIEDFTIFANELFLAGE